VFIQVTSVKSYAYNELKPLLEKKDDKTYVIDFGQLFVLLVLKSSQ